MCYTNTFIMLRLTVLKNIRLLTVKIITVILYVTSFVLLYIITLVKLTRNIFYCKAFVYEHDLLYQDLLIKNK